MDQERILVIDDEASLASVFEQFLLDAGHQVRVASSAADGLAAIADRQPDVVFMDIRMPELDGLELVQRLARLDTGERPEVIFVSGHAGFDEAVAHPSVLLLVVPPALLVRATVRLCLGLENGLVVGHGFRLHFATMVSSSEARVVAV